MGALVADSLILLVLAASLAYPQPLPIVTGEWSLPAGVRRVVTERSGRIVLLRPTVHEAGTARSFGETITWVGGYGWNLDALDEPSAIASDGLSIFIADRGNHRIVRCDRDLRPLSLLMTRDTSYAPARFGFPLGVAISARGDLCILDGDAGEIVVFGPDGRLRWRAGHDLPNGRQLSSPVALAVDEAEYVYVLDGREVRQFDAFGNAGTAWSIVDHANGLSVSGGWIAVSAPDTFALCSLASGRVTRIARSSLAAGNAPGQLTDVAWQGSALLLLSEGRMTRLEIDGLDAEE